MSFSDRLKEARKKAGYTQAQIADKLKITVQSYSQYETGKRNPKRETLEKIADALSLEYSYTGDGEPFFYEANPEYAGKIIDSKKSMKDVLLNDLGFNGRQLADTVMNDVYNINVKQVDFLDQMDILGERLNDYGKNKAIEQVEMLTKIPEYQKNNGDPEQE